MSDPVTDSHDSLHHGAPLPTLPGDTPSSVPPPPAAAPLVQPTLPALPTTPSAVAPPAVPAPPSLPGTAATPVTPAPPTIPTEAPTPSVPHAHTTSAIPTLPDSQSAAPTPTSIPDSPPAPAGQPHTATGHDGIAELTPTLANPTVIEPALIDTPVLPPVGMPAAAPDGQEAAPDGSLDKFGLPTATEQNGPREIPEWKRRQNSKGRKAVRRLLALVVVSGMGVGGFFAYQSFQSEEPTEPADAPDGAQAGGAIGGTLDDAANTVDAINDDVVDVELIGPGEATAPDVSLLDDASYRFRWSTVGDVPMEIRVDGLTKNYEIQSPEVTLRRVGLDIWVTADPADGWSQSDVDGEAAQTFLGLDRFVTVDAALPEIVLPHVVADSVDEAGVRSVSIDDAGFAAASPAERAAWLQSWALDTSTVNVAPITVVVAQRADGVVEAITVTTPDSGAATTYQLLQIFDRPSPIDAPALGAAALPTNDITGG